MAERLLTRTVTRFNKEDNKMKKQTIRTYNVFKQSKDGRELLESVQANDAKEVQKSMVVKYMAIALSTQTQLVVELA